MSKNINNINVNVNSSAPQYVRQQKGHSVLIWLLISIITAGIGFIVMIYYTVSKNHFWHL
jgi:hypothetical protein